MAQIAITGATGLIGGALARVLRADGHGVHPITRRPAEIDGAIGWDPSSGTIDRGALEGLDALVHLAGEPIGPERWTAERRARIRDSRVDGTRLIAEALASLDRPPPTLVSGSAVGIYGSRGDEVLTEDAAPGDDFLAEVCAAWEEAAEPARAAGIRVVHPRTGVVLARGGPLIEAIDLPFRLGVGGRVGDGRQYVPWIALDDHVAALRHLIDDVELAGPVNLVAPEPVTNRELTRALGAAMRRPTIFPVPVFAVRLLYGEMGVSLATASQRVVPRRLLDRGFVFRHTDVHETLRAALAQATAG